MNSSLEEMPYKLKEYIVLEILGEGHFGKVAKCVKAGSSDVVAVKILKANRDSDLKQEASVLQSLSVLKPDKTNIVRFIDFFEHDNYQCMAFEMLDRSLFDLMRQRSSTFNLSEIRPLTQQLLVAFEALKSIGIVHKDLKPDNVMLVNHKDQPLKIKLIDFGLAAHRSELSSDMILQPLEYRAPEFTLGLPLSEAVDMWSLGCCLGMLHLNCYIFSGNFDYDNIRTIVHLLGQPSDELLDKGKFTKDYFVQTDATPQWRLKTLEEFQASVGCWYNIMESPLDRFSDLDEAVENNGSPNVNPEYRDRQAFLSLLKNLLHLDPEKRITPSEALQHPFITMEYLAGDESDYAQWACDVMTFTLKDVTPGCAPKDGSTDDLEKESIRNEASSNDRDQPSPNQAYGDCGSCQLSVTPSETSSDPPIIPDAKCHYSSSPQNECIVIDDKFLTTSRQNKCIEIGKDNLVHLRPMEQQERTTLQNNCDHVLIEINTQTGIRIYINQPKDDKQQEQENVPRLTETENTAVADSDEDIDESWEEEERAIHISHQPAADACAPLNTAGSSEHNMPTADPPSPRNKSYISVAAMAVEALLLYVLCIIFYDSIVAIALFLFILGHIDRVSLNPHPPKHDPHTASRTTASRTTPATTRRPPGSTSRGR